MTCTKMAAVHKYSAVHHSPPNLRIAPEDPMQIEANNVISIAESSLSSVSHSSAPHIHRCTPSILMIITSPSPSHIDFKADQQIHVYPIIAPITKSSNVY